MPVRGRMTVAQVLAALERQGTRRNREGMARYAIVSSFALLAGLALHDRVTPDAPFRRALTLVERAAPDERNFVKKGVSWALRSVGERSEALHAAAIATASRLAGSSRPAARWVGKDALRQLGSPAVRARVAARGTRRRSR